MESKVTQHQQQVNNLNQRLTAHKNASLENNLRNDQRNDIYTALKRRDWNSLERFRRHAAAYEWNEGYQQTPVYDKKWRERDPILKALRDDENIYRLNADNYRFAGHVQHTRNNKPIQIQIQNQNSKPGKPTILLFKF